MSEAPATHDWCGEVAAAIEQMAGARARQELEATWHEHASRPLVEITLIGPQDSGKSSVLRRLLADAEVDIPPWLTVSARRETFELNEIDVGRVTVTDTPGFGTTNQIHEQIAEDALALSDAFVLIVPPNLVTSRLPLAEAILSGEYWLGHARHPITDKVLAVIAQADTLGPDPEDDLDAMRDLAQRKSRELITQLEGGRAGSLAGLRVFVTSADPYEGQAREPNPQKTAFDPFREWDGIDRLALAVDAFAERRAELRAAAMLRYYCRIGLSAAAESRSLLTDAKAAARDLEARQTELAQIRTRGEALVDAARADLENHLRSLGADLTEEVPGDEAHAGDLVQDRLSDVVDRWAARFDAELDVLLGEAAQQVDRRLERPAAQHTATFLRALREGADSAHEQPSANSPVVRLLNNLQKDVGGVVRSSFELKLGARLDKLIADLGALNRPRAARTLGGESTGARLGEATSDAASKARTALIVQGAGQIAQGVLAIATTVEAEIRQQRLDAELRNTREKARDELERTVTRLATVVVDGDPIGSGWSKRLTDGLDLLRDMLSIPDDPDVIADMVSDIERRTTELAAFEELLVHCPTTV